VEEAFAKFETSIRAIDINSKKDREVALNFLLKKHHECIADGDLMKARILEVLLESI